MIQAIFLDAAGTLIHPAENVGAGYARVAGRFGIELQPEIVDRAFGRAWKSSPPPDYRNGPSTDADRGWWQNIVRQVFADCLGRTALRSEQLENIFAAIYAHYSRAEAWRVFPEVEEVLFKLGKIGLPLLVVSNFDPRLRGILDGHNLTRHFHGVIISSEVGSYKPEGRIFQTACDSIGLPPSACLHVGDDPRADLEGAKSAGLSAHLLNRPESGLEAVFQHIHFKA